MSGMIWDDMERLKLALSRWAADCGEAAPPDYVQEAWEHATDAIADAWPPSPQPEAAEPEPDLAAVVYCGGKTFVRTEPPSQQPVAAEDMAEAKHVVSGWGQTDLAIEKAAGRPFPAFHVATLDTLKAGKVPADVNCVTVLGIRAEGDVPPFMMRRRDRPQVAEPEHGLWPRREALIAEQPRGHVFDKAGMPWWYDSLADLYFNRNGTSLRSHPNPPPNALGYAAEKRTPPSVVDRSFLGFGAVADTAEERDKALIEQYRRCGILTSRTDDLGK